MTLTLHTVSVPAGYTLTEGLFASLASGASDTFSVSLDTATLGIKSGQTSFSNNDSDENPFNFTITANVIPVGDMNGDTVVNLSDVTPLILALVDRAVYEAHGYLVDPDINGDIDGDGMFDLGDIGPFSGLFGGPTSASSQAVPEPTTLSLAVVLLMGIVIRQRRRA